MHFAVDEIKGRQVETKKQKNQFVCEQQHNFINDKKCGYQIPSNTTHLLMVKK